MMKMSIYLSIVKSLVEMHGGEVNVTSRLGIGSEFIIKMPINIIENEVNVDNQKDSCLSNYVEKVKIEFSDVYL